jgi:hypothetical protein
MTGKRPIRSGRKLEGQQREIEAAMSGFKTGSLSQLSSRDRCCSQSQPGEEQSPATSSRRRTGGSPRQGRDRIHRRRNPSQFGGRQAKPRSRMEDPGSKGFVDFFNAQTQRPNRTRCCGQNSNITIPRRPRRLSSV